MILLLIIIITTIIFGTGQTAFASVVLWRHQYIEGILFRDIEMIKMLRVSSEMLSVCDTGNCCLSDEVNKDNCLLGKSVLEFDC